MRTVRRSTKICRCGVQIVIRYESDESSPVDNNEIEAEKNGYFRSGKRWPNYVYCRMCHRRHDLTKFEKLEVV